MNRILKSILRLSAILFGLLSFYAFGNMDHSVRSYKTSETEQDSTEKNKNPLQEPSSFIDSIQQYLVPISSKLEKLDSLYSWTIDYKDIDPSKSLKLALLGQQKSLEISNQEWETKFDFEIGSNYIHLAQYDNALNYFDKIISDSKVNGNQSKQAKGLNRKGFIKANQGNFLEAVQFYLESLNIFEALKDQEGIANDFIRISEVLGFLNRHEEGVSYGEKALIIFEQQNDTSNILIAYQNIAENYLGIESYEDALIYIEKSLDLAKISDINLISMASLFNSKGNVLKHLKRYDESIDAYKQGNQICTELNHPGGMSATLANTSDVYMRKGDYKSALPFLKESYALAIEYGFNMNIIENLDNLSTIYRELNDFENALKYREQHQMVKDSVLSVEKDQITKDLSVKYETEKKETLIILQEEQLSRQNLIQMLSYGFAVLLILILLLLYKSYKDKQKNNDLLTSTNNQLEVKNQENELLLKEIHHRVKNNLQTISSLLSLQSESISDKGAFDAVQESKNRVTSMALIHQKLYQGENLAAIEMRDYFETIGKAIIESFGEKAENISLKVEMKDVELDVDTAVPVGLITNELITNSIKHAFPNKQKGQILITLSQEENGLLKLNIADNGDAIASEPVVKKEKGFGTLLIQLLTTQLGGKLEKSTEEGTSTIILFAQQEKSAA
ncbi:MAG: two-component sensor histidine kinase/tetratricopeptide (TPR) repeat protein [Ulvibacter sp.]|jgi:two-component sensor histidine kinase/tetratricopeptide (TPR) repeat protein